MSLVWKEFDLPCENTSILSLFPLPAPYWPQGRHLINKGQKSPSEVFEEFFWVSRWPNLTVYMCWHLKNSLWLWFFVYFWENPPVNFVYFVTYYSHPPRPTLTRRAALNVRLKKCFGNNCLSHTPGYYSHCAGHRVQEVICYFFWPSVARPTPTHTHIHKSVSLGYIHFL